MNRFRASRVSPSGGATTKTETRPGRAIEYALPARPPPVGRDGPGVEPGLLGATTRARGWWGIIDHEQAGHHRGRSYAPAGALHNGRQVPTVLPLQRLTHTRPGGHCESREQSVPPVKACLTQTQRLPTWSGKQKQFPPDASRPQPGIVTQPGVQPGHPPGTGDPAAEARLPALMMTGALHAIAAPQARESTCPAQWLRALQSAT
jgi:hypothetical protein